MSGADVKQWLCELYGCEQPHVKCGFVKVMPKCTTEMYSGRCASLWFCMVTTLLETQTVFHFMWKVDGIFNEFPDFKVHVDGLSFGYSEMRC